MDPARSLARRLAAPTGFTFLEILVVMGVMAVLLAMGIGFLTGVGKASLTQQAAAILAESGQRCLNMSAGGKRATLEIRRATGEGGDRLRVQTAVQRTVLTANFEPPPENRPEMDWFVYANGPDAAKTQGNVRIDPAGHDGGAAVLSAGSLVDFGTRAAFAMTDGVDVDVWVKPAAEGRGNMTVVRSEGDGLTLWAVQLAREAGAQDAYRVVLRLALVAADASEGSGPLGSTPYVTSSAPVVPNVWSHLQVSYDGREPSIRVNGIERYVPEKGARTPAAGATPPTMRLHVPPSGVARITLSAPDSSYMGAVDTLDVAGVFRTDEDLRWLPLGVDLLRPSPPVRVTFFNGGLDLSVHNRDVELRLVGPNEGESGGYEVIRFGLYGNIPPPYRVEPSLAGSGKGQEGP